MIKNVTALEIKVNERIYKFLCEVDSPLGEVHDILSQMKNFVVERINKIHEQEQKKANPDSEIPDKSEVS